MARVDGFARADGVERVWSLVFAERGWQRSLRVKGFFAGYETKEEMKMGIKKQMLAGHKSWRDNTLAVDEADSAAESETAGVEKRGPAGDDYESKELSCKGTKDVVLAERELDVDHFRGSSLLDAKSALAEGNRNISAAAESFLCEKQLPVVSTAVRGLVPAVPLLDTAHFVDEESESSLVAPVIRHEVDNFAIHTVYDLISITTLPVYIDGVKRGGSSVAEKVFLVGTTGPDRSMFKERVDLWRLVLDTSRKKPVFLVKTRKGAWVRLLHAVDSYAKVMRDAAALGYFLNFVKRHPNASKTAAEESMQRACRTNENEPVLDRLSRHIMVIRSFVDEDKDIARAKVLREIFPYLFAKKVLPQIDGGRPLKYAPDITDAKRKAERLPLVCESDKRKKRVKVMANKDVKKPKVSMSSTPDLHSEPDSDYKIKAGKYEQNMRCNGSDGEHSRRLFKDDAEMEHQSDRAPKPMNKDVQRRIFTQAEVDVEDPPICFLCDDGGGLVYCEGPCQRHFHAVKGSGVASFCDTLGFTSPELKEMGKYYCPNCEHKQQQCFICGDLGSSVSNSHGRLEVQRCDVPFCKKFYHAECAAEMVSSPRPDWQHLANAIIDGREKLYCPRHCCSVCGKAELKDPGMLVQCRRCPKAWHRKCLTNYRQSGELVTTPIWNHHDREFIYCRNHRILKELQTPARTHINFPTV